jgi:hypothetical protein
MTAPFSVFAIQIVKGGRRKEIPPRGSELVAMPLTINFPV